MLQAVGLRHWTGGYLVWLVRARRRWCTVVGEETFVGMVTVVVVEQNDDVCIIKNVKKINKFGPGKHDDTHLGPFERVY